MMKFKKDYNLKIISVLVAIVFLLNGTAYGIDLSNKIHLRAPLLCNSNEGGDRTRRTLTAILDREMPPIVRLERTATAYEQEQDNALYEFYDIGKEYEVKFFSYLQDNRVGFEIYKAPSSFDSNDRLGYGWVSRLNDKEAEFKFRMENLNEDSEYILMRLLELIKTNVLFLEIDIFKIYPSQIEADWLKDELPEYSPMRTLVFYMRKYSARLEDEERIIEEIGQHEFNRLMGIIRGQIKGSLTREDMSRLWSSLLIDWDTVYRKIARPFLSLDLSDGGRLRRLIRHQELLREAI